MRASRAACVRHATRVVLQRGLVCGPAVAVALRALCTATATTTQGQQQQPQWHMSSAQRRAAVRAATSRVQPSPCVVDASAVPAAMTRPWPLQRSMTTVTAATSTPPLTTRRAPQAATSLRWLAAHTAPCRCYGTATRVRCASSSSSSNNSSNKSALDKYRKDGDDEEQQQDDGTGDGGGPGYLPFPPPFHTINVVMLLLLANVLVYLTMHFGSDDWRDFIVEHCTLSRDNWRRIYPLVTNAFYQENLLQLLIDGWLLWQFGETMLNFLGNTRLTFFALLCTLGGGAIHLARQHFELYYGKDELEVRGRCYGPNPFIMGLIAVEGLIFRHLNFIQQPPVPFLVLTAFVMVIDVWRIFTTLPEEHGAATGGALMAYLFWALPTRMLGLDKLTAAL